MVRRPPGSTRTDTLFPSTTLFRSVLRDGPVKSLADLKGRRVGFSVAGVEEALLAAMLARHDLALDDVELVNVNWSLSPSLMSRQVDAVIGAFRNFELNQLELDGVAGRCFYPERSDERRVGKGCVSRCRFRCSPYH